MATSFRDLGVAFGINVGVILLFLVLYSVFSKQPINARVYFTKWFVIDSKNAEKKLEKLDDEGQETRRPILNIDPASYLNATTWLRDALFMPQVEFIQHVGLDGLVFLRLFMLGIKIFLPIGVLGFLILVPVNVTDNYLSTSEAKDNGDYGEVDRFSLSNVHDNSNRLWAHVVLAYVFTFWACRCLVAEYKEVARLRLDYLAELKKQPDQFSILVRQVPKAEFETIEQHVDHFFLVNHPDYYFFNQVVYNANKLASLEERKNKVLNKLTAAHIYIEKHPTKPKPTHKVGMMGCCGKRVDTVEFYEERLEEINNEIRVERKRLLSDSSSIMPASFVTFRKRWGAAVAAQTQQSRDNSKWLTEWAPEPRDVVWGNLAIPYLHLNGRHLTGIAAMGGLVIFFMFPVTLVQSLANLDSLGEKLPWLKPVLNVPFINSVLQAYLPGLALKIFLAIVPYICMYIARFQGLISYSSIERNGLEKYYLVLVVNIFWASVITGSIAKQIKGFADNPTSIPTSFGNAIPTKAVFFITYCMVDGWASLTAELFRLVPLALYHFQGLLLVRTPRDRVKAMNVQGMFYAQNIPQCLFYFLVAFVYCVITPITVPFVVIFFFVGYFIYRNQLINVYHAQYESAAAFWPAVHTRIISAMLVHHVILIGLLVVKKSKYAGPFLIPLPIITYIWHVIFCKIPYENAFKVYALEEAMKKDTIDASHDSEDVEYDSRKFLHRAYLHPAVNRAMAAETDEEAAVWQKKNSNAEGPKLVALSRYPTSAKQQGLGSEDGMSEKVSRTSSMATGELTPTKPLLGAGTSDSNKT